MKFNITKINFPFIILFSAAILFPLLYDLGGLTIRQWDESRLAVNAFEMSQNGNLLVTYFQNNIEMWNTKPPLLIWIQALFIKIVGPNSWAIRLPTAFAMCGMIFFMFHFACKYLKDIHIGLFSALMLVTSTGIIEQHVARTGDYDGLLLFWVVFYSLSYFKYLSEEEISIKRRYIFHFFIGIIGAGMTKGLAGFLMMPGLFLYTIYSKQLIEVFKDINVYKGIIVTILIIGGYYSLREIYNPGYFEEVMLNEFGRFSEQQSPKDVSDTWFYINRNIPQNFSPWIYFIPVTLFLIFKEKNLRLKQFGIYGLFLTFTFVTIITLSSSKFAWYDAPFYPFAAMVVSITLSKLYLGFIEKVGEKREIDKLLLLTFLSFGLFYANYNEIAQIIINRSDKWNWREEQYGAYLLEVAEKKIKNFKISFSKDYNGQSIFYKEVLNTQGFNIKITKPTELIVGDTAVFCYADDSEQYIKDHFNFEIVLWGDCQTVKLISRK